MLAAGDVGVGELVKQNDLRPPGDDRVDVHLLENRAFVFDLAERDGFELRHQFLDSGSAVRLRDTDDHVLAASVPANSLAQHGKGFANPRRITEEKLEHAFRFLGRRDNFEPVFGTLGHRRCNGGT